MRRRIRMKRTMRTRIRPRVSKNRVSMMIQSKLGKGKKIFSRIWRVIHNLKIKRINFPICNLFTLDKATIYSSKQSWVRLWKKRKINCCFSNIWSLPVTIIGMKIKWRRENLWMNSLEWLDNVKNWRLL